MKLEVGQALLMLKGAGDNIQCGKVYTLLALKFFFVTKPLLGLFFYTTAPPLPACVVFLPPVTRASLY
jgi:hypothetical protein